MISSSSLVRFLFLRGLLGRGTTGAGEGIPLLSGSIAGDKDWVDDDAATDQEN